jgi:superfamily I DNA and/or RNA helicase
LIRQELGEERVECETVDSYQGQENHIIILSLGAAVYRKEALTYLFL